VSTPPPAKKSPLPWILGGCGCLFLLALIAVLIGSFLFVRSIEKQEPLTLDPLRIPSQSDDDPPAPPAPLMPNEPVPSDWITYVSDASAIPPGLAEHFLDFSFAYPPRFRVVPDDSNFIKVEESTVEQDGASYTLENFAVGYLTAGPEVVRGTDQTVIFPELAKQLSAQFAQGFPNYKELGQSPAKVAGLDGLALLFEAEFSDTPKGNIRLFGKLLLARPPGKEKGVAIIMLASSLDPEVSSAAEVGVVGDMGPILESFRFGE